MALRTLQPGDKVKIYLLVSMFQRVVSQVTVSYLGETERFCDTSQRQVRVTPHLDKLLHIQHHNIHDHSQQAEIRKAFSKLGDSSALASSAGLTVIIHLLQILIILFSEKGQEEEVARGELRCLQEAMARECNQVALSPQSWQSSKRGKR